MLTLTLKLKIMLTLKLKLKLRLMLRLMLSLLLLSLPRTVANAQPLLVSRAHALAPSLFGFDDLCCPLIGPTHSIVGVSGLLSRHRHEVCHHLVQSDILSYILPIRI